MTINIKKIKRPNPATWDKGYKQKHYFISTIDVYFFFCGSRYLYYIGIAKHTKVLIS